MTEAPQPKSGDWIKIGSIDAVVTDVRSPEDDGRLEVVCNPDRPALYGVNWNGEAWEFEHPMRGDYADRVSRVLPFVEALRRGKSKRN
jgi:hypothetical protein